MKNNTAEVLRNVKLLEQTKIIVCSPRDAKYELIQLVLDEVIRLRGYKTIFMLKLTTMYFKDGELLSSA